MHLAARLFVCRDLFIGLVLSAILGGCAVREESVSSSPAAVGTSGDDPPATANETAATGGAADETAAAAPVEAEFPGLPLAPELYADGWVALFDGHSLYG